MGPHGSSYGGQAEESWSRKPLVGALVTPVSVLTMLFLVGVLGCSSPSQQAATTDPAAKLRLQSVLKFYQMYTNDKKSPPSDEKSFKEYLRSLPQDQKDAAGMGEDIDRFLTSPRDGQKIHIEYKVVPRPAGQSRALAWEETGQKGARFVALTNGYVQEYNEVDFEKYKKKK